MKFTKHSLSLISILSASLIISGCSDNSSEVLVDDFGQQYRIYTNDDGSETIRYLNDQYPDDEDATINDSSVTIKRNEDNSIDYISGNESLILGLAAGYLLFHGVNTNLQYDYDRKRYVPSTPVTILSSEARNQQLSNYKPNTTTIKSTARSGFGSAGARSSAS